MDQRSPLSRTLFIFLALGLLVACGDDVEAHDDPKEFFSGPIAPDCEAGLEWCAEVEVLSALECVDVDLISYRIDTEFSGQVDVSCGGTRGGELSLSFAPMATGTGAEEIHAVRFTIEGYDGPGRYPLVGGEGDGLYLQGAPSSGSSHQADERTAWATGGICDELRCDAIVHEGSERIPSDPNSV